MTTTMNQFESEALRAVEVVLAHWDQQYFQDATEENGFKPRYPKPVPRPVVNTSNSTRNEEEIPASAEPGEGENNGEGEGDEDGGNGEEQVDQDQEQDDENQKGSNDSLNVDGMALPDDFDLDQVDAENGGGDSGGEVEQEQKPKKESIKLPDNLAEIKSSLENNEPRGVGGKGIWKYRTELKGTDSKRGRVQFFTVWNTPTKTAPVPRAVGGVWFTYEKPPAKKFRVMAKDFVNKLKSGHETDNITIPTRPHTTATEDLHPTLKEHEHVLYYNGDVGGDDHFHVPDGVDHPLEPVATITYRFEHNHMSHTIAVPNDVYCLPLITPSDVSPEGGVRLSVAAARIPEIIESRLEFDIGGGGGGGGGGTTTGGDEKERSSVIGGIGGGGGGQNDLVSGASDVVNVIDMAIDSVSVTADVTSSEAAEKGDGVALSSVATDSMGSGIVNTETVAAPETAAPAPPPSARNRPHLYKHHPFSKLAHPSFQQKASNLRTSVAIPGSSSTTPSSSKTTPGGASTIMAANGVPLDVLRDLAREAEKEAQKFPTTSETLFSRRHLWDRANISRPDPSQDPPLPEFPISMTDVPVVTSLSYPTESMAKIPVLDEGRLLGIYRSGLEREVRRRVIVAAGEQARALAKGRGKVAGVGDTVAGEGVEGSAADAGEGDKVAPSTDAKVGEKGGEAEGVEDAGDVAEIDEGIGGGAISKFPRNHVPGRSSIAGTTVGSAGNRRTSVRPRARTSPEGGQVPQEGGSGGAVGSVTMGRTGIAGSSGQVGSAGAGGAAATSATAANGAGGSRPGSGPGAVSARRRGSGGGSVVTSASGKDTSGAVGQTAETEAGASAAPVGSAQNPNPPSRTASSVGVSRRESSSISADWLTSAGDNAFLKKRSIMDLTPAHDEALEFVTGKPSSNNGDANENDDGHGGDATTTTVVEVGLSGERKSLAKEGAAANVTGSVSPNIASSSPGPQSPNRPASASVRHSSRPGSSSQSRSGSAHQRQLAASNVANVSNAASPLPEEAPAPEASVVLVAEVPPEEEHIKEDEFNAPAGENVETDVAPPAVPEEVVGGVLADEGAVLENAEVTTGGEIPEEQVTEVIEEVIAGDVGEIEGSVPPPPAEEVPEEPAVTAADNEVAGGDVVGETDAEAVVEAVEAVDEEVVGAGLVEGEDETPGPEAAPVVEKEEAAAS
ncbi:hypothetical protein HDU76_003655 [Blyttiomyces sp. JEL0837]|nr:hypothetical protein HDU76_003655 [Blyttiomyces sp. JEL0837]